MDVAGDQQLARYFWLPKTAACPRGNLNFTRPFSVSPGKWRCDFVPRLCKLGSRPDFGAVSPLWHWLASVEPVVLEGRLFVNEVLHKRSSQGVLPGPREGLSKLPILQDRLQSPCKAVGNAADEVSA